MSIGKLVVKQREQEKSEADGSLMIRLSHAIWPVGALAALLWTMQFFVTASGNIRGSHPYLVHLSRFEIYMCKASLAVITPTAVLQLYEYLLWRMVPRYVSPLVFGVAKSLGTLGWVGAIWFAFHRLV